jgi:hypothetical protein
MKGEAPYECPLRYGVNMESARNYYGVSMESLALKAVNHVKEPGIS